MDADSARRQAAEAFVLSVEQEARARYSGSRLPRLTVDAALLEQNPRVGETARMLVQAAVSGDVDAANAAVADGTARPPQSEHVSSAQNAEDALRHPAPTEAERQLFADRVVRRRAAGAAAIAAPGARAPRAAGCVGDGHSSSSSSA